MEQVPDADCVVVPIGGGGLIAGILTAIKEQKPSVKVIGVQAEGAAAVFSAWKSGRVKELKKINTIAEGIAVKKTEEINLSIISKYIDDIVLVNDDDIRFAMKTAFDEYKVVVETAGVASLAAVIRGKTGLLGRKIVSVITGGNISLDQFILHTA
jgi:threonine dehydratase